MSSRNLAPILIQIKRLKRISESIKVFPKESNDNHAVSHNVSEGEQRSKPKKSVRWRERLEETSGSAEGGFIIVGQIHFVGQIQFYPK